MPLAWTIVSLALAATVWAAPAPAGAGSADVPYVGCETDVMGGVHHLAAPTGAPRAIDAPPVIGLQLAFYQAQRSAGVLMPGIYAPRHWHCYAYQGAGIAELVVAPRPLSAADVGGDDHPDPGISLLDFPSDTGPGFNFASQIIASYFPQRLNDFLQRWGATSSGKGTSGAMPGATAHIWPADSVQSLDERTVLVTTPLGSRGFGTSGGWFSPGPLPVHSLIVLDRDTYGVHELRVRLPPVDASLLPVIERAEHRELAGR
ncbi:MAG TPA: hypothetical protein VKT19_03405 [Steroidobacteraceae bacterium]|nr:hypothetical protein [Steroidobacteraceae bacterium]